MRVELGQHKIKCSIQQFCSRYLKFWVWSIIYSSFFSAGKLKVLTSSRLSALYTLSQNGCHMEKNWGKLHENKVIRASLGWIRNKKVSQLTLRNNCHFSSFSNLSLPWKIICKTIWRWHLTLMTSFSCNLCQFFPCGSHFGIRCMKCLLASFGRLAFCRLQKDYKH